MTVYEDVQRVVGDAMAAGWYAHNPELFMKDGRPYGLIATMEQDGTTVVMSCAVDNGNFTKSMVKRLHQLAEKDVMFVTDVPERHELMKKYLSRYGFSFLFSECGTYMYSIRVKEK